MNNEHPQSDEPTQEDLDGTTLAKDPESPPSRLQEGDNDAIRQIQAGQYRSARDEATRQYE